MKQAQEEGMEPEAERSVSANQEILKTKYAKKLLALLKTRGISHLRIDDIVRHIDISKATFYKYFCSKEDILEQIVKMIVGHMVEAATEVQDDASPYAQRFQTSFKQSLFMASFVSKTFLDDLQQSYPELLERIRHAQQHYYQHLRQFYEQGIAAGVFQLVNPHLLVLQEELVLHAIMDPVFLIEHDLTLRKALYDFYVMQKYLVLTPGTRETIDDTQVKQFIEEIAQKISLSMR
jgi:AcrR family transcriptional regulator